MYLRHIVLCKFITVISLQVHFIGEEADDAGGVKKEFFMLLFQELLQEKYDTEQ